MPSELAAFIEKLRTERRFAALDEASTKQGIVLSVLSKLGWDSFNVDEVVPEYAVGERKVDYALRLRGSNKVFIEVKRPIEELEKHQDQLLDYSFREGVKLAVLTNGSGWWFYLPLNEGSWEQRKFYTIDLVEQEPGEVSSRLVDFLSKQAVETEKALENAQVVYKSRQKTNVIREALPRAWDKVVSEADEPLIELLASTAEKICGYRPDAEAIEQFLLDNRQKLVLTVASAPTAKTSSTTEGHTPVPHLRRKDYTGKAINGFSLRGRKYRVGSWIDLLLELCNHLNHDHGRDFERVLELVGRERPYFSKRADVLRKPKQVNKTSLFVESNLSANSIVRLSYDMIALFGYPESDLNIELSDKEN